MKRTLLFAAAVCLIASSAHAVGCDLTVGACPGNAGAGNDAGTLDCAGGATLTLLATFQPAEAIPDLVGMDCSLDFCVQGDVNTTANFWNVATSNPMAMDVNHRRPRFGCSNHIDRFDDNNSASGWAAAVRSEDLVRIAAQSFRLPGILVARDARLFAIALMIDTSTSAEASGSGQVGCTMRNGITLEQVEPGSLSGAPTTLLTTGSQMLSIVYVNGAVIVTPTRRESWGVLKSLYR